MTAPYYADDQVTLWAGDCRRIVAGLPDTSVDSIVTDPPYELGFMGKGWDASGIAYDPPTRRRHPMTTKVRPLTTSGAMTTSDGVTIEVNLELRYSPMDPVFIHARFFNADQSEQWEIGRELFDQVRDTGCAGTGDVRMHVTGNGSWMFSLREPDGHCAAVAVDRRLVEAFLTATLRVCPVEAELEWLTAWSVEASEWLIGGGE